MEVKLPLEVLASLTSKSPDELKAEIFEGEGDQLTQKVNATDYIKDAFGAKLKQVGTDQYMRRERELKTQHEQVLAQNGIDVNVRQFNDILIELAAKTQQPADKAAPLEELLKRRDVSEYLKTATDKQVAALKSELDKTLGELNQTRSEYTRTQKLSTARSVLERELDALGWDDGGELRSQRLKLLASQLPLDQMKVENGQVVMLDDSGEVLKDQFHNPVPFSGWVERHNVFGSKKQTAARTTPPQGGQQGGGSKVVLASIEAGNEMLKAARTPDEKAAVLRALAELSKGNK